MLLWAAIILTILAFARVSRYVALLMLPYLAWTSFAAVLFGHNQLYTNDYILTTIYQRLSTNDSLKARPLRGHLTLFHLELLCLWKYNLLGRFESDFLSAIRWSTGVRTCCTNDGLKCA